MQISAEQSQKRLALVVHWRTLAICLVLIANRLRIGKRSNGGFLGDAPKEIITSAASLSGLFDGKGFSAFGGNGGGTVSCTK